MTGTHVSNHSVLRYWVPLAAALSGALTLHAAAQGVAQSAQSAPNLDLSPRAPLLYPAADGGAGAREVEWSFRELGVLAPIALRGVDGHSGLGFGIRLDEVVSRARLKLRYTYSPALLADLSHLKLVLNNEVIGTVPLPREPAGTEVLREFDIDPRYFTDFNHLEIHFLGHYTLECEDALHSSLWASISNGSSFELGLRSLNLNNDLALLPTPFFDRRDNRRLELPFVFAGAPDPVTLRAAGALASWFGAQAGYRSARFPVHIAKLPPRRAVVFATNAQRPAWLKAPAVTVPTLSMIDHPQAAGVKLLLIRGQDSAQLGLAADALALGRVAMSGDTVTVSAVQYDPRRPAYDAPNWLRTDRPVKFGEMVTSPGELQAVGHAPSPVRVNLRVPPDMLTWNRLGVPVELRYRYTPPIEQDNSLLSVSINEQFVQSFRLRPSARISGAGSLLPSRRQNGLAHVEDDLVIPAFHIGANNQLQFQFVSDFHKQGQCKDTLNDNVRQAIDPDSTIDLTAFPHYAPMPDLALFANGGFPFTKYADLAETVVVLPQPAQVSDIEAMLFLLGRMGRITGVPAIRVRLATAEEAKSMTGVDLLVIGGPGEQDLLAQWGQTLPAVIDRSRRRTTPAHPALAFPRELLDTRRDSPTPWKVELESAGPMAAIVGFESPVQNERSVIAVASSSPEVTAAALDALEDEGLVGNIRGDVSFVRGRQIDSYQIADNYHVGSLPLWLWLRFHFSGHPVLLALLGILAGLLLAFAIHWNLKRVAARRLDP